MLLPCPSDSLYLSTYNNTPTVVMLHIIYSKGTQPHPTTLDRILIFTNLFLPIPLESFISISYYFLKDISALVLIYAWPSQLFFSTLFSEVIYLLISLTSLGKLEWLLQDLLAYNNIFFSPYTINSKINATLFHPHH